MEKTNQEIYDKMIECFNIVLNDTRLVRNDTFEIIDKNTPNFHNIRKVYDFCFETDKKIEKIENTLIKIQKQLDNLINENTK